MMIALIGVFLIISGGLDKNLILVLRGALLLAFDYLDGYMQIKHFKRKRKGED
jgi:hypothetical protein